MNTNTAFQFPADDAPLSEVALSNLRWAIQAYRSVKATFPNTPPIRLRNKLSWTQYTQSNRDEIRACIRELRSTRGQ